MVQFPDGVVWVLSLLFIMLFTIILGVYFLRKGLKEHKKKYLWLGILFVLGFIIAIGFAMLINTVQY